MPEITEITTIEILSKEFPKTSFSELFMEFEIINLSILFLVLTNILRIELSNSLNFNFNYAVSDGNVKLIVPGCNLNLI
jgi:hypothetical protein